jgi:putative membrane protein
MIERIVKVKKLWANIFAVFTILAFAGFYELIEMWAATIFVPELGPMFLGTQGDVWDTQHDIELAFFGSSLTIILSATLGYLSGKMRWNKARHHNQDRNVNP